MHEFEYVDNAKKLLTTQIVQLLATLYEHKGKQQLFIETKKDELATLVEVAKIQSTKSSNRIEGIYTTDKRLEELVTKKKQSQKTGMSRKFPGIVMFLQRFMKVMITSHQP